MVRELDELLATTRFGRCRRERCRNACDRLHSIPVAGRAEGERRDENTGTPDRTHQAPPGPRPKRLRQWHSASEPGWGEGVLRGLGLGGALESGVGAGSRAETPAVQKPQPRASLETGTRVMRPARGAPRRSPWASMMASP